MIPSNTQSTTNLNVVAESNTTISSNLTKSTDSAIPAPSNNPTTTNCINRNTIPIYYQNIRSVPAKDNLYHNLQTTIYDIICLTETWFTEKHKTETYIPPRFTVHRLDRNQNNSEFNRAGGVAILIDIKHNSTRLKQFESDDIEGMCVEIRISNNSFVLYIAYVPELDTERDLVFRKHAACIEKITNNIDTNLIVDGRFQYERSKMAAS